MSTADELIARVHAAADAVVADEQYIAAKRAAIQIALGTPGAVVYMDGVPYHSGSALDPVPVTMQVVLAGVADWLDGAAVPLLRAKVNELINAYNQLRADYNAGTVPTAAPAVSLLP